MILVAGFFPLRVRRHGVERVQREHELGEGKGDMDDLEEDGIAG